MTSGKQFVGQRGFPTPNTAVETSACRTFLVPADETWLGLLMGAVEILCNEWAYYQWGDLTPLEAAQAWTAIFVQTYENSLTETCGTGKIQAPFWDETSGDDADDEVEVADQTWYGIWDGETFLESVSYVFLTNFLSTLVSTGAAIKFLTIPRAFRVAIRQNPHGANLLLFLDGGLYKVINGYSPVDKVAEFLIASPGTELLLVVDDTHDPDATPNDDGVYVVDVIRKRLSVEEVTNPNVRYSGTPPVYQVTDDGGTTWTDQPSADPLHSPTAFFPPLPPYTGIECDTAARMSAQLKDSITLLCNVGDAAQAVTGLLEIILLPTGILGDLLSLLFILADWIIDEGQATILAAFTDAVYDDIACTLSCFINPDGSISQSSLDAAWEKVKTDHSGTIATVIDEIRFLFTDAVFSNAGVKREETGDCSACDACDWFVEYDFSLGVFGFQTLITVNGVRGTYTGTTFVATVQGGVNALFMYKAATGLQLTGMSADIDSFPGTGGGSLRRWFDVSNLSTLDKTVKESAGVASHSPHSFQTQFGADFTTTVGYGFDWNCDTNGTGSIKVYKVRISGTGTAPTDGQRVNSL